MKIISACTKNTYLLLEALKNMHHLTQYLEALLLFTCSEPETYDLTGFHLLLDVQFISMPEALRKVPQAMFQFYCLTSVTLVMTMLI